MRHDKDSAARAIQGCLEYLLMDAEEAKLHRVANLIRAVIGELARACDRNDGAAEEAERRVLLD